MGDWVKWIIIGIVAYVAWTWYRSQAALAGSSQIGATTAPGYIPRTIGGGLLTNYPANTASMQGVPALDSPVAVGPEHTMPRLFSITSDPTQPANYSDAVTIPPVGPEPITPIWGSNGGVRPVGPEPWMPRLGNDVRAVGPEPMMPRLYAL